MRDLDSRFVSRMRGRAALEQRLVRLLMQVHQFGRHLATTAADPVWTACVIDGLQAALDTARGGP